MKSIMIISYLQILLFFTSLRSTLSLANHYNILNLGARPDGRTDSSKPLLSAWTAACSSVNPSTIYIPKGRYLIPRPTIFTGGEKNCKSSAITIMIDGTLVAPADYRVLGSSNTWIMFESVTGVSILGGTLDGQGSGLWACKSARNRRCPTGVTTLGFSKSENIIINGLTSVNSQLYHIVFNGCKNVNVQHVTVSASGKSPNTDGIHIQESNTVAILNTKIATGDDCVSVGPGTTNLWIENMACGPGHGISIGSLGKEVNEQGVENVTVKTASFTGTENGVRIKSWARPCNGFVRNVTFEHVTMVNVDNPIIIDQQYCPDNNCHNYQQSSGVRISDVTYQDIHGTSSTPVAVKLDCSSEHPCINLKLDDIKLTFNNRPAQSLCVHADGSVEGVIEPSSCLRN